jgi:4-hydroxy-2-oxoglutarate aldolase
LDPVVLAGTNGEAVTLTAAEKFQLTKLTREIAVKVGRPGMTIVQGCGGQCTGDVISETKTAKEAGADFALVLVPSFFHFAMDDTAIIEFFREVRYYPHFI